MILFDKAVQECSFDNDTAYLYALGVYLSNGGTYENFLKMTPDMIQVLLSAHLGDMQRQNLELIKGIYKLFGGDKDT